MNLELWKLPKDASTFREDVPAGIQPLFLSESCENVALALTALHSVRQQSSAECWGYETGLEEKGEVLDHEYLAAAQRSVRQRGEDSPQGFTEACEFGDFGSDFLYDHEDDGTALVFFVTF